MEATKLNKQNRAATGKVDVYIPDELVEYVLSETQVCGRYLVKRTKGNTTHPMMRLMGFWLLLKAETPGAGWILNYTKQIPDLAKKFGISARTFYTYVKKLEEMKILFRRGRDLQVVSWDRLGKALNINALKKTKIEFEYESEQQIHWWFTAIEIEINQALQAHMVLKKLDKNSEAKNSLVTAMIKRGFDPSRVDDAKYFLDNLFMLYIEDFRSGTEVHDILIRIRSDVNRSVDSLAAAWCISPQLASYWKRRMSVQKIVDVRKLRIVSQWTLETKNCHQNPYCHVIWNEKLKERVWFLADQLTVVKPWEWQEFLKKNGLAA